MRIIQITAGAGRMYCGNCLRDSVLVAAWRRLGQDATMVPVYLPLTVEEPQGEASVPVFFGGLTVYLDQKLSWFRGAFPRMRRWLSRPGVLRLVGRFAVRTQPERVADLTLSMLKGEEGNQAHELAELVDWLQTTGHPDVVCLSNALLVGAVRRIKRALGTKIVCLLGGEDAFVDAMPEPWKGRIMETLADRAGDVDLFVAPSDFYGEYMREWLGISADRLCVIPPAVDMSGYPSEAEVVYRHRHSEPPVLGFFARMCREKGLDKLIEAYVALRRSGMQPKLKLMVGGSCTPTDQQFVALLRKLLGSHELLDEVAFQPNVDRKNKIRLLHSLTVFSVPVSYREAFGMYVIEAMAAGVPVVQPPTNAFPEIVRATGGGVLCDSDDAASLARAIHRLLVDNELRIELGLQGYRSVREKFNPAVVAQRYVDAFARLQ
ncbi:MAG: glycosyltransferase family 4 protein [Verrucomicrobiae bacterium]|nr:glycosyltransferase family 4 protein [Verrucomicrobiae bacterium]